MTFHIPSLEAAEAVSGPEVAAARARGLYQLNWNHKAATSAGAKKGMTSPKRIERSAKARRQVLHLVEGGTDTSTGIAQALGHHAKSTWHMLRKMQDEGLLRLRQERKNAPVTASVTPAGLAWLQTQGGEA